MAMLSEDGAISWKPGGLLLVAVCGCVVCEGQGRFHSPLRMRHPGGAGCCSVWAHPARREGVFHGSPFRRPVRLRAVSAVRASGGPAGSCEGARARNKCGALCCAERQGHPCSPNAGPLPGNLFRRPCKTPLAVGCHRRACVGGPAGCILRGGFELGTCAAGPLWPSSLTGGPVKFHGTGSEHPMRCP